MGAAALAFLPFGMAPTPRSSCSCACSPVPRWRWRRSPARRSGSPARSRRRRAACARLRLVGAGQQEHAGAGRRPGAAARACARLPRRAGRRRRARPRARCWPSTSACRWRSRRRGAVGAAAPSQGDRRMNLRAHQARRRRLLLAALGAGGSALLGGCGAAPLERYREQTPALDRRTTSAGRCRPRACSSIASAMCAGASSCGWWASGRGGDGVLTEDFLYDDGERSQRIWRIRSEAPQRWSGRADDVVGAARGEASGSAVRWQYRLLLPVQGAPGRSMSTTGCTTSTRATCSTARASRSGASRWAMCRSPSSAPERGHRRPHAMRFAPRPLNPPLRDDWRGRAGGWSARPAASACHRARAARRGREGGAVGTRPGAAGHGLRRFCPAAWRCRPT